MQGYQIPVEIMWNIFNRGIFFCFLLIMFLYFSVAKKERAKFSYLFAFCQLTLLVSLVLGTLMRTRNIIGMTLEIEDMTDLMIVPSFVGFFYTMVNQKVSWLKIILVWFLAELPIVLGIIGFIYTGNPLHQTYVGVYIFIFCVITLTWSFFRARRFNRELENSYADNDDRNLMWFNGVIATMIAFFATYLIADRFLDYDSNPAMQSAYFFIVEIYMVIIAYYVNKQKSVDTDILEEVGSTNTKDDDKANERIIAELKKKLVEEFEKKELYCQQAITIKTVAHMLKTNVRYVSMCINKEYGKNFNQYINDLRLVKAKQLLSYEEAPADEIASQLGFSSKATFWRVFQIEYGCSPNQYRNRETPTNPILSNRHNIKSANQGSRSSHSVDISTLTKREQQLCSLIMEGASTDEQIRQMQISKSSLIVMKSRLKKKLGLERNESLRNLVVSK